MHVSNLLALASLLSSLAVPAMALAIGHEPAADAHVNLYNLDTDHVAPRKETNAERMAQGLGPLPPTRRSGSKRASPSGGSNPQINAVKYLAHVLDPITQKSVGTLSAPGGLGDILSLGNDPAGALKLALPASTSSPFALSPIDSVFSGPSNVLAAVARNGPLGPGSPGFAMLGLSGKGSDGGLLGLHLPLLASKGSQGQRQGQGQGPSGPLDDILDLGIKVGTDDSPAQNNIWTIHPNGKTLLSHFTNPDGSSNPTSFITGGTECQHTICLTGDVALFKQTYGKDAKEVTVVAWADI